MAHIRLGYLPPPPSNDATPPPRLKQFWELSELVPEWMLWCYAPSHPPPLAIRFRTKSEIPFIKLFICALIWLDSFFHITKPPFPRLTAISSPHQVSLCVSVPLRL